MFLTAEFRSQASWKPPTGCWLRVTFWNRTAGSSPGLCKAGTFLLKLGFSKFNQKEGANYLIKSSTRSVIVPEMCWSYKRALETDEGGSRSCPMGRGLWCEWRRVFGCLYRRTSVKQLNTNLLHGSSSQRRVRRWLFAGMLHRAVR